MRNKLLLVLFCSILCLVCVFTLTRCSNRDVSQLQTGIESNEDNTPKRSTADNGTEGGTMTTDKADTIVTVSPTPTPSPSPTPEPTPTEIPEPHKVVVLDPGHGGYDPGAYSKGVEEQAITLKVAFYCRDYLLNNYKNIDVYLTREENVHLDRDKATDLQMRCQMAVDVNADALISIHFNASESHQLSGSEIYVSKKATVKQQTFDLGYAIMDELVGIGLKRRQVTIRNSNDTFDENGVAVDYYAINRHCAAHDIPGIIVEAAFMDNDNDRQFTDSDEGLRLIGEADARGIANYLGLELLNPSEEGTDELQK